MRINGNWGSSAGHFLLNLFSSTDTEWLRLKETYSGGLALIKTNVWLNDYSSHFDYPLPLVPLPELPPEFFHAYKPQSEPDCRLLLKLLLSSVGTMSNWNAAVKRFIGSSDNLGSLQNCTIKNKTKSSGGFTLRRQRSLGG